MVDVAKCIGKYTVRPMDGMVATVSYGRVFPAKNSIKRITPPKVKSIQRGYASDPETRTLVSPSPSP